MENLSYEKRISMLTATKRKNVKIIKELYGKGKHGKFGGLGALDFDDKGILPPPDEFDFKAIPNHPSGAFFGPKACGENYRRLLESHPTYIDPVSSLSGGWMYRFWLAIDPDRYPIWNPDFDYSYLKNEQKKYGIIHGIGSSQHFCQDNTIGLRLGWQGILNKVRYYRRVNLSANTEFYDGLENIILGIQNFIGRHARDAEDAMHKEENPVLKENLRKMAKINNKLVTEPPETFHEAVQWIAWYAMVSVMYNASASMGAIDRILKPYYYNDKEQGILTDEEAMFHIACLLLKDPQYYQIGGTDIHGDDITNPVSFLFLDAAYKLKATTNICIRVHDKQNPELLKKAVEYIFKDRTPYFNFISDKNINEGFVKNGYSMELARQREKSGCHWSAIPGREYTMNDIIKINFAAVFNAAFKEMIGDKTVIPSSNVLWKRFEKHLRRAVEVTATGVDFHIEHMHEVFPELVLDLLCQGPIEKGLDATNGGLEFYNICVDGCALATVADSFAAIEQRVEKEKKIKWADLNSHLDNSFKDGEYVRVLLKNTPKYGNRKSRADEYAVKISKTFTKIVREMKTPIRGYNMIPGLFSWANTPAYGLETEATPNGRRAKEPISHGANPDYGPTGAAGVSTAIANAVASVQTGYGNTVPLQIDLDPGTSEEEESIKNFIGFIKAHFNMGGTLINVNIVDKKKILEAYKDPTKYPDLIVRVTGFSAYFINLSKEWQKLIVDRIV